ncbi:axoneme-associated protein mst101(2)-like [Chironomus tepperi]|uniref:axoneme-associated protein mst101(2)-like n=1 Tax=Chironomus tepperi TaxID=113505 RepID=UPI00391FA571
MGKKGKNKNQTANIQQNTVKLESENFEKDEKFQIMETPKVEELKVETEIVETLAEESNESKEGTLKSKKRRNRKKKNTATEINIEEAIEEKAGYVNEKEEILNLANEMKSESAEEKPSSADASTDTLKKKRRRNRKKNVGNVGDVQEENVQETIKNDDSGEIVMEKPGEDTLSSQQNTLKRKRNKNKNKTTVNQEQNEIIAEKPLENEQLQKTETKREQKEKVEPQRRGKKPKRFDLSSKKTISDELQERQEREQKEAQAHIKNEIAKREKLLETIDLVLDCHKTEVELAKNQQESLKDVKLLSQEAAKPRSPTLASKTSKQSSSKKSTPAEEELVNKIEQVLGMTKLEIKNAQTQQAYVSRLEAEVAKVKQSKDILLGGQTSSAVPPHIQKMAKEMRDLTKGEVPKTKDELIKEIESRDALMSEINRVLDNTKSEINKVQKQQKIIQNLEVELNKMKDQEIVEKLIALTEEEESQEPPPPPKQSPATASLLDALMANVGKLKEIQALKEKQKSEVKVSEKSEVQEIPENIKEAVKLQDAELKVENDAEALSVAEKPEKEKSKSPQKDAKKIITEKKQSSPESSPKEQNKHANDQKKQPQKVPQTKSKAEELISTENKKDNILEKIKCVNDSVSVKEIKEILHELPEIKAPMDLHECKSKPDDVKLEAIKHENPESPKKEPKKREHNKDKGKNDKEVKNIEIENQEKKILKTEEKNKEQAQGKIESLDCKNNKDVKLVMPVEVKPITSCEPVSQEFNINENKNSLNLKGNDQKKNDKEQKTSPKSSHKNKNHKHEKKDVLKGVPEVIPLIPITVQKPSMAEMLKNAPDPPPDEIKKQNDDVKVEAAPLARPESAIIEVKPSEQIKEIMQPIMKETTEEKLCKEIAKNSDDEAIKVSSEIQDDEMVIVNKAEVEAEIKEEKVNEQDFTDPKNVQRGGFVSPADAKDAKPLKKDDKQQANKNKSPIKTPPRPTLQKGLDGKTPQNKTIIQKPKSEVQAKINSKPADAKKPSQAPAKSLSPTVEKPQPKFESANNVSNDTPSQKIDVQNSSHEITPPSTDKPKVPPRPDVTKTSNVKPVPRAGNVTNQTASPIKTKTPSVAKATTTSTAQSQSPTAKPKPTVSQTRQSATSKTPINTKSTNQKPLATPQKANSTKTATPKSASSMASATETK